MKIQSIQHVEVGFLSDLALRGQGFNSRIKLTKA